MKPFKCPLSFLSYTSLQVRTPTLVFATRFFNYFLTIAEVVLLLFPSSIVLSPLILGYRLDIHFRIQALDRKF